MLLVALLETLTTFSEAMNVVGCADVALAAVGAGPAFPALERRAARLRPP